MLDRIIEQVKTLSDEEKRRLAALLPGRPHSAPDSSAEGEWEARLEAEGWLSLPAADGPETLPAPDPFIAQGRHSSEILVEERR